MERKSKRIADANLDGVVEKTQRAGLDANSHHHLAAW
jgi:hypothetical protein